MKRRSFLGLLGLVAGASCGLRPQPLATGGIVEGPILMHAQRILPPFPIPTAWSDLPTAVPEFVVRLPDMVDVYQWPDEDE